MQNCKSTYTDLMQNGYTSIVGVTQVLAWLTPDQLQQVLVGFMMKRHCDDVLILIFCQEVALT